MTRQSRVATAALALWLSVPAVASLAHGPAEWIQRGGYKNTAGQLCCGVNDCGEFHEGKITAGPNGYRVNATFVVTNVRTTFLIPVNEIIPYSEAAPSPDGKYWLCKWGGERKCFFFPPGQS